MVGYYLLISLLQKQKNMEDYLLTKHEDCLVHGSLIWNSTELLFYQTIRESANRSRQMKILKKKQKPGSPAQGIQKQNGRERCLAYQNKL